ncbi:MAG: (Fe-S)-binding protein [Trueperaceae bacterium]|nr:(Fe-S)-binding protein [Trueperaceae bacterium]
MLSTPEKIVFVLLSAASLGLAYVGFKRIVDVVARGDRGYYPRFDNLTDRLGSALARTLGQSTVFRARFWVSFFHALVFYGFVFYLFVNLLDVLKGFVPPAWTASLNFGVVGGLYRLGADLFSVLVLVGIVFFLVRRFATGDRRLELNNTVPLHDKVKQGGIRRDSLIVGVFILLHVGFRLMGESFLLAYEGHRDLWQPFASGLAALIGPGENRLIGWHVGWWGALGLILAFLPYFPRSKHIHLFAAPARFALERRDDEGNKLSTGVLEPLDFEDETAEQFGAGRLEHLRFPQILDAYACIQCNRCTNVCPAHVTGKALSPAALEINKRYELNATLPLLASGGESPRDLMSFALNDEALWACTTCGACVEVCPVGCEQMIDIVDMRRDQVLMKGDLPQELAGTFRNLERSGNPWGLAADKRTDWADGLGVPTVADNPDFEVLYWVGCAGSYDPQAQKTARALATILDHAGVNYAILGRGERCTGDPARRAGNEYLYYQLATDNVATLNNALIGDKLDPAKPKRVVTACPHCYNALLNDYPQLGGDYTVVHHSELIDELMRSKRLPPLSLGGTVTYHDPCYLGRHNDVYDAPRDVLTGGGLTLHEMPRHRNNSFCCGAGGAQFWKEEEPGDMRVSENRYQEAQATGSSTIATGCPFCKVMLSSSDSAQVDNAPEVVDIAQLVADGLHGLYHKFGDPRARR